MTTSAIPSVSAPVSSRTSLRRLTLISFGTATLITLVLLVAVIIALSAISEYNNWSETLTEVASRSEDQIAIFLQRGRDLLNLVDSITAAESEQANPDHIESIIQSILITNTTVREIAVIRPDGTAGDSAANTTPLLTAPAVLPAAQWYQTALAGETYLSDVEFTVAGVPVVIMAQPLTTGGVVAAVLDMNVLRDAIGVFDDADPTTTYVLAESGRVVLHPNGQAVPIGAQFVDAAALQQVLTSADDSITLEYTTFNTERALAAFNRIDGSDWIVVRETGRGAIFGFTRSIALGLVIGGTVLWGAIMAGANSFLGRLYFQPLDKLRTAAEHVQGGDLDVRLRPRHSDEIGAVMAAFNNMIEQLKLRTRLNAQLFSLSQRIANAHDADDLAEIIYSIADPDTLTAVDFVHVDTDHQQQPTTLTIGAVRVPAGMPVLLKPGTQFSAAEVPFARLWLLNKDEPVLIEDVRTDPRVDPVTRSLLQTGDTLRTVFIPITHNERWVALVVLAWSQARPFTAHERELYGNLPALLAPIADNLRLIEELETNVQQIVATQTQTQALYDLSQKFANAQTYEDVLNAIFTEAQSGSPSYINFARVEANDVGQAAVLIYAAHVSPDKASFPIQIGDRFPIEQYPLSNMLVGSQSALLLEDTFNAPEIDEATRMMMRAVNAQGVAVLPITQAERWIGVMSMGWNQPHTFSAEERAFYRTLPTLAAPVMDNLRLIEDLEANVQALSEARARAEDSSRLKGEFLSTMSHELRTPLNAIEGYTGIMLTGMGGFELDPAPRRMVERVRLNSRRLLGLVNDFLDLSRIEAGRVEIVNEPLQPARLAARWTAEIGVLAENKGLHLITDIAADLPLSVQGDEDALNKIVSNLLSNAVKFTETGSITLRLFKAADQWAIQVSDTGIGIPKAAQGYIFDEFRQVDGSTTRKYGGTGLGLAIVQKFVRLLNGRITLESEVDQGSTFTVYLPLLPTGQPVLA